MLEETTARQLRDWQLFAQVQPWGPHRDDMRLAVMVQAILAPWQKHSKALPSPFYPYEIPGSVLAPPATIGEMLEYFHERVKEIESWPKR